MMGRKTAKTPLSGVFRQLAFIAFLAAACGAPAYGVTDSSHLKTSDDLKYLTTQAADRAYTEVQIRRIKNMMVSKSADQETLQRWENLRLKRQGHR